MPPQTPCLYGEFACVTGTMPYGGLAATCTTCRRRSTTCYAVAYYRNPTTPLVVAKPLSGRSVIDGSPFDLAIGSRDSHQGGDLLEGSKTNPSAWSARKRAA